MQEIITEPNIILQNYIRSLEFENSMLKKYLLEIEDVILEPPKDRCIMQNSLEYYAILSTAIKYQFKVLRELLSTKPSGKMQSSIEINFPIIQQQHNLLKRFKSLFGKYRQTQIGKDLRPREMEHLLHIECLLRQIKD